jgi:CPA2 family monovalent cation:H+ antiporter-2
MPLLQEIVIIFGLSILVLFAFSRLRIPAVVGFLLTGLLAGPYGLGLVKAVHEVELLADVGVVLLLFTVGMEFSLDALLRIKKSVLVGGSLQVLLTILVAFAHASLHAGRTFGESLFIGFLVSLSSTAIVLKILQDRAEIDSPHGQTSLAILIFQDLIVIPMMLFTPLLAGRGGESGLSLLLLLAKGAGVILLVILMARWILPRLLYQIARTRSRELFLLSVVVLCFAIAWLTSSVGLSLALGAFLAGLILSESEYSYQALGSILPFRDVFSSFFFVSVGMLLDFRFLLDHLPGILAAVLLILTLKTLTAGCATLALGFPIRIALPVGLALAQVGEFSFILARSGVRQGFLAGDVYQVFLAVSVLTMAVTPFLIIAAPAVTDSVMRFPMPERLKSGPYPSETKSKANRNDHLVIIGFGVNGRNLSRAASVAGIPHVIVEMNPETVRQEEKTGKPIFYGDATQETVLHHAGVETARVVVVAISDAAATRRVVETVKRMNPKVEVIARTRFLREMKPLYDLGADEVVPEEFETSVEIFARVLRKYLIPRDEIEELISEVRSDGYQMFRTPSRDSLSLSDLTLNLPDIEISTLRVGDGSTADGKSLAQIELRKKHGVSILAIRRGQRVISNPDADARLLAKDVVIALGTPDRIALALGLFQAPEEGKPRSTAPEPPAKPDSPLPPATLPAPRV